MEVKDLNQYFRGLRRGKLYNESVELYEKLKVHANGEKPVGVIEERRPSESDTIKDYRKKIYRSKTRNPFQKVYTSLSKIRRSPDWKIRFDADAVPARITAMERPEVYFNQDFPLYDSITNWLFTIALKPYLMDANAVVAVIPMEMEIAENEYRKPIPHIFHSDHVIEFIPEKFAIIKSTDNSVYFEDEQFFEGEVYWVLDTQMIQRWEQNRSNNFELTQEYIHGRGYLPAFKVKGDFKASKDKDVLWESRLFSMVDHLDEAAREYSDLQSAVVQHLHPKEWRIETEKCGKCHGTGRVATSDGPTTCQECKGSGSPRTSTYAVATIKPDILNPTAGYPIPPMGFIEMNPEIIKIQNERIKEHIYDALAAVNFEFLAETQLNQSGLAKEVDRDELNNFCYTVAEDLVTIERMVIWMSIDMRYWEIVNDDKDTLDALNPVIPVPERFDLLNTNHLIDAYDKAARAKISPIILSHMQYEIAAKKFRNDPDISALTKCIFELDPLPGLTEDEKGMRLMNGGISKIDYVVSSNLEPFIRKAMEENAEFASLERDKKMEVIYKYASEKTAEIGAANALRTELVDTEGN